MGKEPGAEAHIGTRNGSSLNRGRTCTCSVPQGLSLSDGVAPPRTLIPWLCDAPGISVAVEGEVDGAKVSVDADALDTSEVEIAGLRPASVPSRCISRVTSLAS
jgi:hypothetical protein